MLSLEIKKFRDPSWDFRTADTKRYTHCFHPYPAMMIPQVAGRILDEFGIGAKTLFDPFCGTGTSLVEANLRGINAVGTDINPLARLIAKVKTTPLSPDSLNAYISDFTSFVLSIRSGKKELTPQIPKFQNLEYWFKKETLYWLAVIKTYIESIKEPDIRDFFKVAFSETVREVSLTRNSEFKLYRMNSQQIKRFNPDVLTIMFEKLERNRKGMIEYILQKDNKSISYVYGFDTVQGIPSDVLPEESVDIVVTSPPYGDSRTTVAYGQFSRLSNQWLGLCKVNEVDKKSLGGTRRRKLRKFGIDLLDEVVYRIASIDPNRALDVVSFYVDYERSINNVAKVVRIGGIVAYVVGNRKVKGVTIPNDEITRIMFERNGFAHVVTIVREIPNKKMPKRNSPTNVAGKTDTTMNQEYIVILKRVLRGEGIC